MEASSNLPAFLFDLDGTLVDSVYQHVVAWREALERSGIELAVWRIHRRIGMSGGLLVNALLRETGHPVTSEQAEQLPRFHAEAYGRMAAQVRPLPGASELLSFLTKNGVPWAIATSGQTESARRTLKVLGIGPEAPLITRDQVQRAKPDPDLFIAAAKRLETDIATSIVVGDSVWDLLSE
jgi:HAD superfamily hydrolase (TIGR01549 family)